MKNFLIAILCLMFVAIGNNAFAENLVQENYVGLRSEIQHADLILRVAIKDRKTISLTKDKKGNPLVSEMSINASTVSVFKGQLEPQETSTFFINYAQNSQQSEELYPFGHLFFANPIDGEMIFLVRSVDNRQEVINALWTSDELIKDYIEIAKLNETDAALELTRMLGKAMIDSNSDYFRGIEIILDDWRRLKTHLSIQTKEFAQLQDEIYPEILQTLRGQGFSTAVILATLMNKDQRKEIVRYLLDDYARNEKRLIEIRANPPPDAEELTWEMAEEMEVSSSVETLPAAMKMIMEANPDGQLLSVPDKKVILEKAEQFSK